MANHTDLYERYFDATFGRFYPEAQRLRILGLVAASLGVERDSDEFATVLATVQEVEAQDIDDLNDAKNYLLVCELLASDAEVSAAAEVLVNVLTEYQRQSRPTYSSHLDWVVELRSAVPFTDGQRLDNALLEYSTRDAASAMSELRVLVNNGSFPAVAYLACICEEEGLYAAAYHYFSLLKRTYELEVEIAPFPALAARLASLAEKIGEEATRIDAAIAALPPFLTTDGTGATAIGFGGSTQRRYTYEH